MTTILQELADVVNTARKHYAGGASFAFWWAGESYFSTIGDDDEVTPDDILVVLEGNLQDSKRNPVAFRVNGNDLVVVRLP